MAKIKHLLLIIAVKIVKEGRKIFHNNLIPIFLGLGQLLAKLGLFGLRIILLPPYWLWQKGRLFIQRFNWRQVNLNKISLHGSLVITAAIIIIVAINNYTSPIAKSESFGQTALIGAIIEPSDDFDYEQIWTEGPIKTSSTPPLSYNDADLNIDAELEKYLSAKATPLNNLAISSGPEDALIALGIPTLTSRTRTQIETYQVQPGDTISLIAYKFNLKINTLLWANNLTARSILKLGQNLIIPPVNGVIHLVKKGETLSNIAKKYKVTAEEISEFNKLADSQVKPGLSLMIPGGQPVSVAPSAPATKPTQIKSGPIPAAALADRSTPLMWPTTSRRITQYYRWRHSGLDVGNRTSEPIYAADDGVVVRAQWNSGYGYNVVIDHGNGMRTLYGHASRLLVSPGQQVARGAVIALIGSTGRSTGPHLHFEVIVGGVKKNPLSYIR